MKVFQARPPVLMKTEDALDVLLMIMRDYVPIRIEYAEALQAHRQAIHSFDVERMHKATDVVSDARRRYMVAATTLREAHKAYKAAFRNLLVGKYL